MPPNHFPTGHPTSSAVDPVIADLGFAAFAERNRPRYTRYAKARLSSVARSTAVVEATLVSAHDNWQWLMSQPCPAAEVWEELRRQVDRRGERAVAQDPVLAVLYRRLPNAAADSVVLCRRLGFPLAEAAELMGVEPSAVEAALASARRALPQLVDVEAPLRHR
ncbi:sigma factor-like helix-turn-helix DNA-binding protein [Streptomyces sp. NPDC088196]|uniref:sigma factor-like helix-turn-helix DNA-binding protein n=1 Tax=Streptomyces sp. NPDC088196 TaxID=3154868 RepID=UPI00344E8C29